MKKLIMVCVAVGLISAGNSEATITLNCSELSNQPIDGLNYRKITSRFVVAGDAVFDTVYRSPGTGITTFLEDPSLQCVAESVLNNKFVPGFTDEVQFGFNLSTNSAFTSDFNERLFNAGLASFAVAPVKTSPLMMWTKGQFSYNKTPISQEDFKHEENSTEQFAHDILTFDPVEPLNSVPSPGALLLGSMGAVLVSWLRRNKTL